jgi:hypothetical protein
VQAIPRDIVMGYLNDMVRRLATSANLEAIVAKHLAEGTPLTHSLTHSLIRTE